MGPMTGRAAGYCAGYDRPGYANPGFGRGFGGGYGWGRGWRHQYFATGLPGWARAGWGGFGWRGTYTPPPAATTEEARKLELDALREQTRYYKDALESMEKRIRELEGEQKK